MTPEEITKFLRLQFSIDNKYHYKELDYISWEIGFQRGMEYQQKLDKRVLDLEKKAKGLLGDLMGKFKRDNDEGEVHLI